MNAPATIQRDLRAEFPGLVTAEGKPWHYLDTAATAQKPRAVIDAMARAMGEDYATVHRGVYARSAEMTLAFEEARRKVAGFIGGREDELVFTRGATEAINLVAYSYPDKGRVLLSTLEHHSNIVPWQLAGWQVDVCPLTADGRIDLDAAEAMLEFVRNNAVDHLIVGARGSGGVRRYMGSVSTTLVAEAPCSVTVVRNRQVSDADTDGHEASAA